jgi:uncharacterized protein YijF (DUF1287 family)
MKRVLLGLILAVIGTVSGGEAGDQIANGAFKQVGVTKTYDPEYVSIAYPNGDIDPSKGVCADVVVRALRAIDVDLQKEIHVDMSANFTKYPDNWGLKKPDKNIDHRRVPNIMRFLERKMKTCADVGYAPGDIVAWKLKGGLFHIGVVSTSAVPGSRRYFMIHNIGSGAKEEDVLNSYEIIGHYRW